MGQFIDITGKKFNNWTVLRVAGRKNNRPIWECRCSCGTTRIMRGADIRLSVRKSCGCVTQRPWTDLSGMRFGRWIVIRRGENSRNGLHRWECKCDCGTARTVLASSLTRKTGNSTSCGCRQREDATIHGASRESFGHPSPEYYSWRGARYRCTDPKSTGYKYWGGRGVTMCDRWQGRDGFENFLADMGRRPEGTTLDRIDTYGNYEPGNCRWADHITQNNNKRRKEPATLMAMGLI